MAASSHRQFSPPTPSTPSRRRSRTPPPIASRPRSQSTEPPPSRSRVPLLAEDIRRMTSRFPVNWAPPPLSRLIRNSLASFSPPQITLPSSSLDDFRDRAKKILQPKESSTLIRFLNNLSSPYRSTQFASIKLLRYLKDYYLTTFCLRLFSFFKSCGPENVNLKDQALDALHLLLIDGNKLWEQTSFLDVKVKSAILDCLKTERSRRFAPRILDFVVSIFLNEIRHGDEWPDVVHFLDECLGSDSEEQVKCALFLLYKMIPTCTGESLAVTIDSFLARLKNIFDSRTMTMETKVYAALTTNHCLLYWFDSSNIENYHHLLSEILKVLSDSASHSQKLVQMVLKELTKLALKKADYMRPSFVAISELMILIMDKANEETGFSAIELVLSLYEGSETSFLPSPRFIIKATETALIRIEDEEWEIPEVVDENNAMKLLAKMAAGLGGHTVIEVIVRKVKEGTNSRSSCAGLIAVKYLSKVVYPYLQIMFHQLLFEALIMSVNDYQNPSVQAHAASAMVVFVSGCPQHVLEPYLEQILPSLFGCIEEGEGCVPLWALRGLTACFSTDGFKFKSKAMPFLKRKMQTAVVEGDGILHSECLNCFSKLHVQASEKESMIGDQVLKLIRKWHLYSAISNEARHYHLDILKMEQRISKLTNQIESANSLNDPPLLVALKNDLQHLQQLKADLCLPDAEALISSYLFHTEQARASVNSIHRLTEVRNVSTVETIEDMNDALYLSNAFPTLLIDVSRV